MRRSKKNKRRVAWYSSDNAIARGFEQVEEDPLLKEHERKHETVPDRSALLAAMEEADVRVNTAGKHGKPTGKCHTCERDIGPDRIYCGPCMAKRYM